MRNALISILTSLDSGMRKTNRIFIQILDTCLLFSHQLQTYDPYFENIHSIFEYYFDNHVHYVSMFDNTAVRQYATQFLPSIQF